VKGTARKRGPNRWQIQVFVGVNPTTGKERRVTRTVVAPHNRSGQKVVDRALAALILEAEDGRISLGDDPTVSRLLERWVAAREPDWSPKTTMENKRQIRLKIEPAIGKRRVSKLRAADLDSLYSRLRKSGGARGGPLGPASVRRIHLIMHAALGQAVKWGIIATNVADAATPPKQPSTQITPPDPEALAKALKIIDERDDDFGLYLRLAATTGARRSQLIAVHWSDVDLDAATITFARAVLDGGPDVGLVERGTKTGRKWKVALAPATADRLRTFRAVSEERAAAVRTELGPEAYVFAREPDGSVSWRPDTVTARWVKLRSKVGLDGVRLHDLRHYVATQLLGAGVDPRTVAGRLGHANPNVTMTVYGHFLPEKDRAAADFLDGLLDG
jgi:integrase